MRLEQAALAVAVILSSVAYPAANVLGALLFAGLAGWARACAWPAAGNNHHSAASRWLGQRDRLSPHAAIRVLCVPIAGQWSHFRALGRQCVLPESATCPASRATVTPVEKITRHLLPSNSRSRCRRAHGFADPFGPGYATGCGCDDCQTSQHTVMLRACGRCCKVGPTRVVNKGSDRRNCCSFALGDNMATTPSTLTERDYIELVHGEFFQTSRDQLVTSPSGRWRPHRPITSPSKLGLPRAGGAMRVARPST